jgi:hypothetical protein
MAKHPLSHALITTVIREASPLVIAAAKHVQKNAHREGEAQRENQERMTPHARYVTGVFRRTIALFRTVDVLLDARRMLTVFPSSLSRAPGAISRDRWVDYHYGYFTVSLASLPDIALVLTASVFNLGVAPKHCTVDVITSHARIKGTPVVTAIRGVAKSVAQAKERRNLHVHRGDHADVESAVGDRFLRDLKMVTLVQSIEKNLVDAKFLAEGWREARRALEPVLEQEMLRVTSAILPLLEELLPEYTRISKLLAASNPGRPTAS